MIEEFRGAAVEADDLLRHLKQVAKEKGENEEKVQAVLRRNGQGMTTIFVMADKGEAQRSCSW